MNISVVEIWYPSISKAPYSASSTSTTRRQPPEDGGPGLADGDAPEGTHPARTQAAGHLLLGWVGVAEAGGDREIDQQIDRRGS